MKLKTRKRISHSLKTHYLKKRLRRLSIASLIAVAVISWAYVFAFLSVPSVTTYVNRVEAYTEPIVRKVHSEDKREYYILVDKYAEKHDVSFEELYNTIACESRFVADIQSEHRFEDNTRERSFGLAQIYIDVHDVSLSEAIDPEFAVEWMAKRFAEGKKHWWTCWRELYQS